MNWLSLSMQVLAAVLDVYMILLLIRIVLTWVSMDHGHPVLRILHSVCDPYLNWFRRFRFLVIGPLDFSPLAALLVVNFFSSLARMIGMYGQVTLGIVLSILVSLLWGAVSFFFLLLGVLSIVRFLAIQFRWGGAGLWSYLDALLQPPAYGLGRLIRPKTFLSYTTTLLLLGGINLVAWALGGLLIEFLTHLLLSLPF
jgi:YggT family protein